MRSASTANTASLKGQARRRLRHRATSDPTFKAAISAFIGRRRAKAATTTRADGSFKNIVPFRTLGSDGGIGHIMLSARYDTVDLNRWRHRWRQADVLYRPSQPGSRSDHIKMQLDYSRNNIDLASSTYGTQNTNSGHANVVEMRTQIDW